MNRDNGKTIIYLYNLFVLCFWPMVFFLMEYWVIESNASRRYGGGMGAALIIILAPEVIFGLKMDLNKTFGGRIFTILSSMVVGWILHKLFYHYQMVEAYAPKTYYTTHIMLALGIIWTIVIEFNQTLREHILLFPRDQWLFPHSEDEAEDHYWKIFTYVLYFSAFAFALLRRYFVK